MRHAFRFPRHIRRAVRNHVERAIQDLDPQRYRQEPAYTAALAGRLEGTAYEDDDGFVVFRSTVIADRGRGAAEFWSGTDLVITSVISDGVKTIQKAILIQSKLGRIEDLKQAEQDRLYGQIKDMQRLTRAPKIMEIVNDGGIRTPRIVSGNRFLNDQPYRSYDLSSYMTSRVLTTFDGDTRPDFVQSVQDSTLTQVQLLAGLSRELPNGVA